MGKKQESLYELACSKDAKLTSEQAEDNTVYSYS